MERNVLFLYTNNTYLSIGLRGLNFRNLHFKSFSINAISKHDADPNSIILIDLDSLEKARGIKTSLLSEKLSKFPYIILIGGGNLRYFLHMLLPESSTIRKNSMLFFLRMLDEGGRYNLIMDNLKIQPEQKLTKREFQIVLLFMEGWNQFEICNKLKIKEKDFILSY
ncbi:hypothetical protein HA45_22930 [Pantoea rodasii]|uniref:response regulator transcription factor n=1 Tax=Pantoea rodasii TaxID=1076549 RepID=UPI000A21A09C|nr:response regulator transcription factor [Pantoea rodasii]ORM59066.1 hypothetical protein HA45_22930 [Pantoea rodasii]